MSDSEPAETETVSVFDTLYDELRRIARDLFRTQGRDHTLQPTALVHEYFVRIGTPDRVPSDDRSQFVATATVAMRRMLIDHARRRKALKRGGGLRASLDAPESVEAPEEVPTVDLLVLDEALTRFEDIEPRAAQVVSTRFFGGLSVRESAAALGLTKKQVELEWRYAKAWFERELGRGAAAAEPPSSAP